MDLALDFTAASHGTPSEGDLIVDATGDLATIDGGPEIGQLILMRMRWFAGEWFLDTSVGVPWLTEILGQKTLTLDGENALQNAALTTPGVLQLLNWQTGLNNKTRVLSVGFAAKVSSGIVDYSGTLNTGVIGG